MRHPEWPHTSSGRFGRQPRLREHLRAQRKPHEAALLINHKSNSPWPLEPGMHLFAGICKKPQSGLVGCIAPTMTVKIGHYLRNGDSADPASDRFTIYRITKIALLN